MSVVSETRKIDNWFTFRKAYQKHYYKSLLEKNKEFYDKGRTLAIFEVLERDLLDFLDYIPLEYYPKIRRKEITSPKLEHMLIVIGSRIDSFFRYWDVVIKKNLVKVIKDKGVDNLNFGHYKASEEELKLAGAKVVLRHTGEIIKPFHNWTIDIPKNFNEYDEARHGPLWMKAYNNVKHFAYFDRSLGNLDNTIMSLAALFVLNCKHEVVWEHMISHGYIDRPYIFPDPDSRGQYDFDDYYMFDPYANSKLFRFWTRLRVTREKYFGLNLEYSEKEITLL
jgi:hypothetical protein